MPRRKSTGNQPANKTEETPKQTPATSGRKVRTNRRGEPKRDRRERFN